MKITKKIKPPNILQERIENMAKQWRHFSKVIDARIAHWFIEDNNLALIDEFIKYQKQQKHPDLFIKLESPFINEKSYGITLKEELNKSHQKAKKIVIKKGIKIQKTKKQLPGPFSFFKSLNSYLKNSDIKGYIAIYLAPTENEAPEKWIAWLKGGIKTGIPQRVRIIIADTKESPLFEKIADKFPIKIITLRPKLDIDKALNEVAEMGDPNDPVNQFQKVFLNVTKAAKIGDLKKVEFLGQKALMIAQKQKWPNMKMMVHMTVGQTLVAAAQIKAALKSFDRAKSIAKDAFEKKEPAGASLLVNAYFAEAGVYFKEKKYLKAAQTYEKAIPISKDIKDAPYFHLEAYRMAAYSYESLKRYQTAWNYNQEALKVGDKMDEEIRANSTLPYIGQALLRLAKPLKLEKSELIIYQRMIELVGPEWNSGT